MPPSRSSNDNIAEILRLEDASQTLEGPAAGAQCRLGPGERKALPRGGQSRMFDIAFVFRGDQGERGCGLGVAPGAFGLYRATLAATCGVQSLPGHTRNSSLEL